MDLAKFEKIFAAKITGIATAEDPAHKLSILREILSANLEFRMIRRLRSIISSRSFSKLRRLCKPKRVRT